MSTEVTWVVLLFIQIQWWIFPLCYGWCDSHTSGFDQVTPITWRLWRQFKGILLHPWYHRKYESLLPRKPPCDVPCRAQCYICKKKAISEKCEEDVACVRHAGLRKCLSLPCCGACMPGSLPSVVLTHGSFDIAYSYWYVKGRCVKSECCQLCVGCGRCCGASWCGIRWQICDTVWVNRTQESKEWE